MFEESENLLLLLRLLFSVCVSPHVGWGGGGGGRSLACVDTRDAKVTPMSPSESKTGFVFLFFFLLQTFFLDINHNLALMLLASAGCLCFFRPEVSPRGGSIHHDYVTLIMRESQINIQLLCVHGDSEM